MGADKDGSPLRHGSAPAAWTQAHDAVKTDAQLWGLLRLDGVQSDGSGGVYEVRTCPQCESSIYKPISREQAIELCCQLAKLQAQALEALHLASDCGALQPSAFVPQPAIATPPLKPTSP